MGEGGGRKDGRESAKKRARAQLEEEVMEPGRERDGKSSAAMSEGDSYD